MTELTKEEPVGEIVADTSDTNDVLPTPPVVTSRSGACPFCLRKHLLKIRGYSREVAEDPSREWELDNLLENLLLAEDHAAALGDMQLVGNLRAIRINAEAGESVQIRCAALYDSFRAKHASEFSVAKQGGH